MRDVRTRLRLARKLLRLVRDESGQAMAEYSTTSIALLGGAGAISWPFTKQLILAYQTYYDSIYYMLNLPLP